MKKPFIVFGQVHGSELALLLPCCYSRQQQGITVEAANDVAVDKR